MCRQVLVLVTGNILFLMFLLKVIRPRVNFLFRRTVYLLHPSVARSKQRNNLEWDGALGFRADGYYLYGFQPDTLKFAKSQLQQQFFTFDGRIGLRNTVPDDLWSDLSIPMLKSLHLVKTTHPRASEADMVVNVPVEKTINEHFAIDLGFTADVTNYTNGNRYHNK